MAIPSSTFTEAVASTLRNHPSEVADAVENHNGFLTYLRKKGKIVKESGGYVIARNLAYQENGTYTRYSGYGTLNNNQSDVLTAVKADWFQASVAITMSGRERRMNMGREQIFNLIKGRIDVAKSTAKNNQSVDIYSDGSLTNQMYGLSHILQTNGQGTVHGIDSATYTNWRNQFSEMAGTGTWSKSTIKGEFNKLALLCTRGVDHPDLAICSHDIYSAIWEANQDLQRYTAADESTVGFKGIKFNTPSGLMTVIHDSNTNFSTTAERAYFLNCDTFEFIVHPDANWSLSEELNAQNQDAFTQYLLWMGALICKNRRLNGILIDAA
jgi:hypothetical protein